MLIIICYYDFTSLDWKLLYIKLGIYIAYN